MIEFPALKPTSRSYTPGQYPVKRFDSISGAGVTRLYGSKAYNATLELSFVLNDADTSAVMACWHEAYGSAKELKLPAEVFAGNNGPEQQIPEYLTWRWAEMPQMEALVIGRTRLRAKFIATLDA